MVGIKSVEELRGRRILVVGIGGGGDVVSAVIISNQLRRLGAKTIIGGVLWERYMVDPIPGPIPLTLLRDCETRRGYALVTGSTYAYRGGSIIVPQISRVAKILREDVIALDLTGGVRGLVRSLDFIGEDLDVEWVVGVDVGGDVLALGCEEDSWSPLADQMMLSAISNSKLKPLLAIQGLGCDGELNVQTLYKRLGEVAVRGGLISIRGLEAADTRLLEELVGECYTEASKIPLLAFKGFIGELRIRSGTRKVDVNIIQAATFYLDPMKLYEIQPLAKALRDTESFEEAVKVAHNLGVFTEYDLELEISTMDKLNVEKLIERRKRRREELKLKSRNPLECT